MGLSISFGIKGLSISFGIVPLVSGMTPLVLFPVSVLQGDDNQGTRQREKRAEEGGNLQRQRGERENRKPRA